MSKTKKGPPDGPSLIARARRIIAAAASVDIKNAKAVYDKAIGLNIHIFFAGAVYCWLRCVDHLPFAPFFFSTDHHASPTHFGRFRFYFFMFHTAFKAIGIALHGL